MTKAVRIENADTGPYKLVVETYDGGVLVSSEPLNHPTAMLQGMVHSTRYLVVREAK